MSRIALHAVIAARACPDLPDTPRDRVGWIAEILLTALTDLGLQATCAPRNDSAARQDICFRASSGSEIEVAGGRLIDDPDVAVFRGDRPHSVGLERGVDALLRAR